MKVRKDFVSNSSSSSFIVFGSLKDTPTDKDSFINIEDIAALGEGEAFLIVLKNHGNEGDYIFKLTPELLMDCDMHQIDLSMFTIVRGKVCMNEGGYLYRASDFTERGDDYDSGEEDYNKKAKSTGIPLDGMKMFKFEKDYGNPEWRHEILNTLEAEMNFERKRMASQK